LSAAVNTAKRTRHSGIQHFSNKIFKQIIMLIITFTIFNISGLSPLEPTIPHVIPHNLWHK